MSVQQDSRRSRVMSKLQSQLTRGTKTVYADGKQTEVELSDKDVKRIKREIDNIKKNMKAISKPSEYSKEIK